jgi:hypothetical protein
MSIIVAPEARVDYVPTQVPMQTEQFHSRSRLTVLLHAAGKALMDLAYRRSQRPVALKRLRYQDQHLEESRDLAAQMYTWMLPK